MVFYLRSHTWFRDLMKLRLVMSPCRKNSARDKVVGKKGVYLERNALPSVGAISEGKSSAEIGHG